MQNSSLFQENLKQLLRFCPSAEKSILDADLTRIQHCKTEKGEDNLLVNIGGKSIPLYDPSGAAKEAEEWLEEVYPIELQILFLYGIGLGTYFDVLKEWLSVNPRRYLILIDDDSAVVSAFLQTEQAKQILNHPQVVFQFFTYPDENGWGIFRKQFSWICRSCANAKWAFAASRLFQKERENDVERIHRQIAMNIHDMKLSLDDQCRIFDLVNANFYNDLPYIVDSCLVDSLYDKFVDVPFVICGAGPSLSKQFETLKTLENKAFIAGSATGFNILSRNGIVPHCGYCLDPFEIQESRQLTHFAFETPAFYQNRFYFNALPKVHGPRIYTGSLTYFKMADWFNQQLGLPAFKLIDKGVSTSTALTYLAQTLGANPIILVGVDLAYSQATRYAGEPSRHATDELVHTAHDSLVKKDRLNAPGIVEPEVETTWDWIEEASYFTDYARNYPNNKLVNATEGGLKIYELPHPSLKEAVDIYMRPSYDIQNWFHTELQLAKYAAIDHAQVLEAMEKWLENNEEAVEILDEIIEEVDKLQDSLCTSEELDVELKSGKVGNARDRLEKNNFFEIFLAIYEGWYDVFAAFDLKKLDFFPSQYNPEQKIKVLVNAAHGRHVFLKNFALRNKLILEGSIANLRRMIERKSALKTAVQMGPPPSSSLGPGEMYRFQEGRLVLQDPELALSHDEPFAPQKISKERLKSHVGNPRLLTENSGVYEGQALLLYPDGAIKAEMFYLKGELHGPSTFYSPNGKVLAKAWFLHGKRVGKSWQYSLDGKVVSLQRYQNGLRQGRQQYYFPTGILKTDLPYADGDLEGEALLYYPTGSPKRKLQFTKGKLHGKEWMWTEEGVLILEAEYKNNLPYGRSITRFDDGQIAKEVIFYDDPSNYDMSLWNEQGKLIHKQTALPNNPMKDLINKSKELQASIQEITKKIEQLKQPPAPPASP